LLTLLHLSGWVALLACSAWFFAIYIIALPLSGVLDLRDIQLLEEIAEVTGPLTPLLRAILSWMSLLMRR